MNEELAKYFSGESTADEISFVENWRTESDENAKAFMDAKYVWLASVEKIEAPKSVLDRILEDSEGEQVPFILRSWVKYASAAVLVLAISLLFVLNQKETLQVYQSQNLTDGSSILLHGATEMEVLKMDGESREVRVKGKAYFDIERDESRPFIIHTNNAKVQVLGTSFLVKASDETTEVCVESGLVRFIKGDDSNVSVKLNKGEMGLISSNNNGIIKKNNNDLNYLAWKTRIITFDETTMAEVESVLEEVYGISMEFENPAFKSCKLTAKFNKKKAKDAIEIIARTFGVEYEFKKNGVLLKGKGC